MLWKEVQITTTLKAYEAVVNAFMKRGGWCGHSDPAGCAFDTTRSQG